MTENEDSGWTREQYIFFTRGAATTAFLPAAAILVGLFVFPPAEGELGVVAGMMIVTFLQLVFVALLAATILNREG